MHFLYIFEDLSMTQTEEPPSEEDLQSVDDGDLIIIAYDEIEGFQDMDITGKLTPVQRS